MGDRTRRAPPPDQAAGLRNMTTSGGRVGSAGASRGPVADQATYRGPPMIVLAGAKGGVGVTTLTLRLADALAATGARVDAIDGDVRLAGLAGAAGMGGVEGPTLADVISGRATLPAATTQAAPRARLVPGARATPFSTEPTAADADRLLAACSTASDAADLLLVDAGSGLPGFAARLWQAAVAVVLVTTSDRLSLLGAYASIKLARELSPTPTVTLLTNRVRNADEASRTSAAIGAACQQFLGLGARPVGFVAEGYLEEHVEDLADRLIDRLSSATQAEQPAAAA